MPMLLTEQNNEAQNMKKFWCYYWAWLGLSLGPNIRADPLQNKVITDYYTAFLNITYFDGDRGVFHTERTETGRFSTNVPKDFSGQVVILANQRDTNESEAIYTGMIFCFPVYSRFPQFSS